MTEQTDPPIFLVDGSSYLFRAYHALPNLSTASGKPTGAIRGIISMLRKLTNVNPKSPIVVIFDAKQKTFRHELFEEYKANRPPMDEELAVQIAPIHQIIKAMGMPLLIQAGYEADDIIGTLAVQLASNEHSIVICTSDKDMTQLVNDNVSIYDGMKDQTMDCDAVFEKFGVHPHQIIDYLTLMGDKSDNIPGIQGVGAKTAAKWLSKYESLDNLVEHQHEIKGKIGERFRSQIDQLPLTKKLVTIDCNVPLTDNIVEQLAPPQPIQEKLNAFFTEFEFKSWLVHSAASTQNTQQEEQKKLYSCILLESELHTWIASIREKGAFTFDTETTSLNYMEASLVGISIATNDGKAAYIPMQHSYIGAPSQLSKTTVLSLLKPLFADPNIIKVAQNFKYDWHILTLEGVSFHGKCIDTMLQSYCLNSVATRHNMDAMAQHYLDYQTISYTDVTGKGVKQKTFDQIDLEQAVPYAAEDACITERLHQHFNLQLSQEGFAHSSEILNTLELPLITILGNMEQYGCLIDKKALEEQSTEIGKKLISLEQKAWDLTGESFNLDSPAQLQNILYNIMDIPVIKKTPKGAPSTSEEVLSQLSQQGFELPQLILEYRSLSKLKSTYTDRLPQQIHLKTQRLHTSYHQANTATGRLSSSNPNLQNIPIRTSEGRKIRKAFIAPPQKLLISADYSQIELRIMAHLSHDPKLIEAFEKDIDVHSATACEIFDTPLDQIIDEQRRQAKAVNFGLIYGMSAFGLAKQLNISQGLAQAYIDRYFERYEKVADFMESTKAIAQENGYVSTIMGRRLHLPNAQHGKGNLKQAALRAAINAPMQGSAADLIKSAMIAVDQTISTDNSIHMIMQVHDELIFEAFEGEKQKPQKKHIDLIRSCMENAADLLVPLKVDIGVGLNWDEAH